LSKIEYSMDPVEKKPNRRYRKGSKYDPILDAFLERDADIVEVTVKNKDANYVRTQLKKRIDARELDIEVSVANNKTYLEK
jgi:hypothetical protein